MDLTLAQAAAALGKTRRQLIYMIEQGRLPAEKVGGRWYVGSAAIAADSAAARRGHARQDRLRDAIEDALLPDKRERRYSMRDLKAFQIAEPLYRALMVHPGADHAATGQLHSCLGQLAIGCHRYARAEKARAYQAARDAASLAALELILSGDTALDGHREALEQDLMPAIAGLLRRAERQRQAPG